MAPPIGNKFWHNRTQHGKKALFSTPESLRDAAIEYFDWSHDNPLISIEFNGKDAIECEIPKMRAFTAVGLCNHLGVSQTYFHDFREAIEAKEKKTPKDLQFLDVLDWIKGVMFQQKFEGAAAGFLNGNLISRELGMLDKTQTEVAAQVDIAKQKIEVTVKHTSVSLAEDTGIDETA